MTLRDFQRMLAPLSRRISNLLGRGVVNRADDSEGIQTMQVEVRKDEVRTVERVQNYGVSSVPPAGSESVIAFVGGRGDHGFALATEHRATRVVNLESGESVLYNGPAGTKILMKADGSVEITTTADVTVIGDVVADGISLKTHTHPANLSVSTTGTAAAQTGTATGNTGAAQ